MEKQRPVNDDLRTVSDGDVALGFSIMPHLGEGNITFSPYSIRTALAMVYEGARGDSAKEISTKAYISNDNNTRLEGYSRLMSQLNILNENHVLRSANGIWIENNFKVNPHFKDILEGTYKAQATQADFEKSAEMWRGKINEWVSKNTEGKIPTLFPVGSLDSSTVVALANALYFKGIWENKFNPKYTLKQDYTLSNGEVVQVDMMRKGEVEKLDKLPKFSYGSFDGLQIAVLPYKGNDLEKVIILPPRNLDLSELERSLKRDPEMFNEWINNLERVSFAKLELPKHELRKGYPLTGPLQEMDITSIFDVRTADLSGMGKGPLFIGSGFHEAYFKTDEEGSEGAAATGFATMRGVSFDKPKPIEFVVDKPFLEMILHKPSNSLLFLNRIVDPR